MTFLVNVNFFLLLCFSKPHKTKMTVKYYILRKNLKKNILDLGLET